MLKATPGTADDGRRGKASMLRMVGFNRLRSAMAPLLRPVLEHVPPVRWLAKKLLGGQPARVQIEGLDFQVHQADFGVTLELTSTGDYEPATRASCLRVLSPGMVFLDIGAHVGLFALPAAKAVGADGIVHAFEPDPENRSMLEANVLTNRITNVWVHPEAMSCHVGKAMLSRSTFNTGDHRLAEMPSRTSVEVHTTTVDAWCRRHAVHPDVIKMDVQGAEPQVVAGMQELLAGGRPLHIFLEFTPSLLRAAGVDPLAFLESFVDHGLQLYVLDEHRGVEKPATPRQAVAACPRRSYVNIRCSRGAPA